MPSIKTLRHQEILFSRLVEELTQVRILTADAEDGVLATMDVLEELLLLHDLMNSHGLRPFLDEKVLIFSLNCAGLSGSAWEMENPVTGPTPQAMCRLEDGWREDALALLQER